MLGIILRHGMEKALLAVNLLCQQQVREKGYADFCIISTADLYKQEGQEAEKLLVSLVAHFRTGEKCHLDAHFVWEITRKPTNSASLLALVVKYLDKPSTSQTTARARARSGSGKRVSKKARTNSPVPRRNQPYSRERLCHFNSSRGPQTGRSQGRPAAHSPQGQRQERNKPTKYLLTQQRQDSTIGGCPATRQACTQGRPRNPSSYRRCPNQDFSEGARNFLTALQELGTQFQH